MTKGPFESADRQDVLAPVLQPTWRRGLPQEGYSLVAYAPSGQHIAVGTAAAEQSHGGSLTILETAKGDEVHHITSDLGITWLAYCNDSSLLAVSERGKVGGAEQARVRILHAGPGPQTLSE